MLRRAAIEFAAPPQAFWRLSLKEWRALAGAPSAPVLARSGLAALMARFPDEEGADQ
ncbi:phage tail assembly chaperone [Caulobacter endophyticus]|uniref:Phage tail assembly chaperone n=2 Tax=Caulobacter endophyticus TaxID=2172652 RepID=A0A2T9K461_9CAUL|nr:phage tail assembly chaperone [Caulobacter endophyticus]PVM90766.1 phage tail assembly chaperone [Caulobacter endophyticus]